MMTEESQQHKERHSRIQKAQNSLLRFWRLTGFN